MDYCARESTVIDRDDVCIREMSVSQTVKTIHVELAETIACLSNIELSLCGEQGEGKKTEEPRSLIDELRMIERMATDCIGLSHKIHDKLFSEGR